MNKILIGVGVLIGSILIIENTIIATQAYILVWYSKASSLAIFSIVIGVMIGYGLRGMMMKEEDKDEDGFHF